MFRLFSSLWTKLKPMILAEVPAESAACEFDCRELDCTEKDWQDCPQRIQKAEAIQALENQE
jgi:hypothetical protein